MSVPREPVWSLLVVACFSRHASALDWAEAQLTNEFGSILLKSQDFSFHHTTYYESTMGTQLVKRLLVFDSMVVADCLPDVKHFTIGLEKTLAAGSAYAESRPINLDPGLLQLGKFLLASTKDQTQRIFLRDGIFAEVTLRFQGGAFDVWPWTYADYREESVRAFLNQARALLYEKVALVRKSLKKTQD
ncbi:MAG: DUF4416 family protein [Planctomycetes bacterium]|jgi:hypothetical protein|nr:DUF4416 family protein [Planctomycetota bacterium]